MKKPRKRPGTRPDSQLRIPVRARLIRTAEPDPRVIYMRYEDMKHDPADTFHRTAMHLGLPFSREEVIAARSGQIRQDSGQGEGSGL